MKKLASLLLALVMLISCVPAMAEEVTETTYTITINENDNHIYEIYQIFVGTYYAKTETTEGAEGEESTSTTTEILSNVKWGQNGTGTPGEYVPESALKALMDVNSEDNATKLAEIKKYVNLNSEAYSKVTKADSVSVPEGYYLLVDKGTAEDGSVGAGDSYSLYVVQVVGETTITPKRSTVSSDKKVDDKNDSNTSEDAIVWQDSADHDIGDAVSFKLSATLPANYSDYNSYKLVFHDEATNFENVTITKVYLTKADGTEVGTFTEADYKLESETVKTDATETAAAYKTTTSTITFANLKNSTLKDSIADGYKVVVEYTAILSDTAYIGSAGNPNVSYVEYSNNPNWIGDANNDGQPDNPDEKEPTGTTPEDKVIIFTFKFDVNKVTTKDNEQIALPGAEFELYKYDIDATEPAYKWVKLAVPALDEGESVFTWTGLDDGQYKLVETKAPAGYNLLTAPIYFKVTATHSNDPATLALTDLNAVATDENGVEINDANKASFSINLNACEIDTNVVNMAGAQLPQTGGMGTTILYVGGGILVLAAIVLLIVKRRANAE